MSTYKRITAEEIHELYRFEVLKKEDVGRIEQTADVLADTFIGVQVGSSYIDEPMMKESKMSKDAFKAFLIECLNEVVDHGMTVVAIDKTTGDVVGSMVSENYDPEAETDLLEGELSAMNEVNLTTDELIGKYFEDVMEREGHISKDKFAHLFLVGVRTEFNKKYIAKELGLLTEKVAKELGVETVFCFSSNFRSQNMFKTTLDYTLAENVDGEPIRLVYKEEGKFEDIPEEVAVDGQILTKSI